VVGRHKLLKESPRDLVENQYIGVQPIQNIGFAPRARVEDRKTFVTEPDSVPAITDTPFRADELDPRSSPSGFLAQYQEAIASPARLGAMRFSIVTMPVLKGSKLLACGEQVDDHDTRARHVWREALRVAIEWYVSWPIAVETLYHTTTASFVSLSIKGRDSSHGSHLRYLQASRFT
jgi:hypothetical protein